MRRQSRKIEKKNSKKIHAYAKRQIDIVEFDTDQHTKRKLSENAHSRRHIDKALITDQFSYPHTKFHKN